MNPNDLSKENGHWAMEFQHWKISNYFLKHLIDFKNLKVTDELNAAQKSATGLGDDVKLCSLIIDAKDTSIKVYREYPEYSFSTLVSDIGGSGLVQNRFALLHVTV